MSATKQQAEARLDILGRVLAFIGPMAFLVAGMIAFAVVWWPVVRIYMYSVENLFEGTHPLSGDCGYAIGDWQQDGGSFASIGALRPKLTPHAVPYGSSIEVKSSQYIVTRCALDLRPILKDSAAAWIYIYEISGDSAVYLNDRMLGVTMSLSGFPISLPREEASLPVVLTIVSHGVPDGAPLAGLTGDTPILAGIDMTTLAKFNYIDFVQIIGINLGRISLLMGLLATLGVAWITGIRFADVTWIVVMLGSMCVLAARSMFVDSLVKDFGWRQYQFLYITTAVALMGFLMAFLRRHVWEHRWRLIAPLVVLTGCGVFYAIEHAHWVGRGVFVPTISALMGLSMLIASGSALHAVHHTTGPRRSKLIAFAIMTSIGGLLYFVQAVGFRFGFGMFGVFIQPAIITTFAVFLGVDLVLFQRGFVKERETRIQFEEKNLVLSDQMTLGQSVQQLLMPARQTTMTKHGTVDFAYHPHIHMAGDWAVTWETPDATIVIAGDVNGKGAPAAITMASMLGVLNESRTMGDSAEQALDRLNRAMASLFLGKMMSTWTALEVRADGCLRLSSGGSNGWQVWDGKQLTNHVHRSGLLGVSPTLSITWTTTPKDQWQSVFMVSDGVCANGRSLKRLVRLVQGMMQQSADNKKLIRAVMEFADQADAQDDRSVLIVTSAKEETSLPISKS